MPQDSQPANDSDVDSVRQVLDLPEGGQKPVPALNAAAISESAEVPRTCRGHKHKIKRLSAVAIKKAKKAAEIFANANRPFVSGITPAGYKHRNFIAQLSSDLGGRENLSLAQRTTIDLAARQMLFIDAIDAYVFADGMVYNRGRRCLYPIIRERQMLVDGMRSALKDLGMERRAKPVLSALQYAALKGDTDTTDGNATGAAP